MRGRSLSRSRRRRRRRRGSCSRCRRGSSSSSGSGRSFLDGLWFEVLELGDIFSLVHEHCNGLGGEEDDVMVARGRKERKKYHADGNVTSALRVEDLCEICL